MGPKASDTVEKNLGIGSIVPHDKRWNSVFLVMERASRTGSLTSKAKINVAENTHIKSTLNIGLWMWWGLQHLQLASSMQRRTSFAATWLQPLCNCIVTWMTCWMRASGPGLQRVSLYTVTENKARLRRKIEFIFYAGAQIQAWLAA